MIARQPTRCEVLLLTIKLLMLPVFCLFEGKIYPHFTAIVLSSHIDTELVTQPTPCFKYSVHMHLTRSFALSDTVKYWIHCTVQLLLQQARAMETQHRERLDTIDHQ